MTLDFFLRCKTFHFMAFLSAPYFCMENAIETPTMKRNSGITQSARWILSHLINETSQHNKTLKQSISAQITSSLVSVLYLRRMVNPALINRRAVVSEDHQHDVETTHCIQRLEPRCPQRRPPSA